MEIKGIDYEEIAELARNEIQGLDLPEETVNALKAVIRSLVDLQKSNGNWHGHEGFALHISDISQDLYNRFCAIADRLNTSVGRLLTFLMDQVIETRSTEFTAKALQPFADRLSRDVTPIQHHKSLKIAKDDLEEVEQLLLQHIKHVTIAEDIDTELFRSKVMIQHCKCVEIPDSISKLVILSKTQFCEYYSFDQQQISASF